MRGRRLGDLSPRDIDRMREAHDERELNRYYAEQERAEAEALRDAAAYWRDQEAAWLESIAPPAAG